MFKLLFCFVFFLFNFLSSPFYSALFKDSLCIHAREKKTRVVIFQASYSREVGGSKITLMTVSIKNDPFEAIPLSQSNLRVIFLDLTERHSTSLM